MQSTPSSKPSIPIAAVVIGCGGVASYLLPCLLRTFKVPRLILHDGDTLEERNLDRQLFSSEQIGMNKAEALADLIREQFPEQQIEVVPEYFHEGTSVDSMATLIVCVDNHTARRNALSVADSLTCNTVIAGNEYTDASGMMYLPQWRGTALDPRVRYPEILTDKRDDPRRPESCQGVAQQANPQLAMANFGAANHTLWLLWYWLIEVRSLDRAVVESFSPIEHSNNFNRFRTALSGEVNKEAAA
jgi:hypothetical protein